MSVILLSNGKQVRRVLDEITFYHWINCHIVGFDDGIVNSTGLGQISNMTFEGSNAIYIGSELEHAIMWDVAFINRYIFCACRKGIMGLKIMMTSVPATILI